MKSSGPVFTRQNPFPSASTVRRAHYHPSRKQSLSKKEKKTTLSPVRASSSQQLRSRSRETQQLYENRDDGFPIAEGQTVFTETWPSFDRGSSPDSSTASPDVLERKPSARSETLSSGVQDDSVLAKYVERFRHGQPRSREERQQMASANEEEQMPFWWMSHSSVHSSTPTKAVGKDVHDPTSYSPAGQHQHDRSLSVVSDTSQGEFDDTEILPLQERASSLLLRGDGSIPVSSDGLGCSDFSSPVTVDEPVRQPLIPIMIKPTADAISDSVHVLSSQKTAIPALVPPTRPEEDILFQWRLRRKMEQARELSQSVQRTSYHDAAFNWQAPSLIQPSASRQPYKEQQSSHPPQFPQRDAHLHIAAPQPETRESHRLFDSSPCPPPFPAGIASGSSVSQTLTHVPAHMHLLCDILPCPVQLSHNKETQIFSKRLDQPQTKVVHKKTQIPEGSSGIISGEHMNSSPHATVEAEVHSHQKVPEKNKKDLESRQKTALPTRQQRKSQRSSSHQNLPKKAASLKEQHQREGSQTFSTKSCTSDHEPSASPVHTALGQVVSEVLFPPAASSPPQKIPASSASLPHSISSSSQPPLPSHSSLEVISQLLQEAEDSDEKEFEDDPLLQVLRQQRKWVKNQISEVDVKLNEFLEEQPVT
ncbi:proline and serine-rich protein 3 isoform X2 [Kryptolebias marmoratus]|uniref:proline and serine-rich protein 3 isoform X2 n=1 Tax=Kryptolebias marmoratus TaxID=37003 RepID=UPI0007F88F33|nr:proline and serine-rich protein 3 isoform X2 [Kryptolebias marmoratus]